MSRIIPDYYSHVILAMCFWLIQYILNDQVAVSSRVCVYDRPYCASNYVCAEMRKDGNAVFFGMVLAGINQRIDFFFPGIQVLQHELRIHGYNSWLDLFRFYAL